MSASRGNRLRPARTISAACLLAAALAVVVAPPAAVASGTATPGLTTPASGPLARTGGDLADAIQTLGTGKYASIWAGIVGVDNGKQIDVYLTKLDANAETAFEALAPTGTLVFVQAPRTATAMATIHQHTIASVPQLAAKGAMPQQFWPDFRTGTERISVAALTAAKSTAIAATLTSTPVSIVSVNADDAAVSTTTRTSDTSAYNGGDSITDNHAGCTTGFGIKLSGTTDLLTAGHCWPVGTTIHNAACTNGPCTTRTGSGTTMGTITKRNVVNSALDTEILNARGYQLVFTGAIGANTKATVAGKTTSPIGYQVCQSGSYSGETCGLVIDATNVCLDFQVADLGTHMYCEMVHAYSPSHGIANQGGNSGGPVFRFSGSSLLATGTITAANSNDSVSCQHYTFTACYWDLYYTDINSILAYWGASLVTG